MAELGCCGQTFVEELHGSEMVQWRKHNALSDKATKIAGKKGIQETHSMILAQTATRN